MSKFFIVAVDKIVNFKYVKTIYKSTEQGTDAPCIVFWMGDEYRPIITFDSVELRDRMFERISKAALKLNHMNRRKTYDREQDSQIHTDKT